jgi:hypothetical protein
MSVCLDFGDDRKDQPSVQVATNRGWADVVEWAEDEGEDAYPALFGLLEHGVSEELVEIASEIGSILEDDPPVTDVAHTLQAIADAIEEHKDEGIVVVSSQFQSGTGGEEEEAEVEEAQPA